VAGSRSPGVVRLRILHIVHQFLPDHVGGVEHYTRALALIQQRAGHQVSVFSPRSGDGTHLDHENLDGLLVAYAVSRAASPFQRFWATFGQGFLGASLAQVVAEVVPDVIHLHNLLGLPVRALAQSALEAAMVATLHDYGWVCANSQLITNHSQQVCDGPHFWLNCGRCGLARIGAGIAWPFAPLVAPLFALRAAAVQRLAARMTAWIAPTAFVADWHIAHGWPAGAVHVVGHGIEHPPAALQPSRPANQRACHFAYIGGLSKQKGVHVLVEAFNRLPHRARLTIAGDETAFPDYCAELRHRAKHVGIEFVGRLPRKEVWQLLRQVDALVVPSLWYETASLVVQEAFAVSTPVVAAGHGALGERVRHEIDGLLVPPGDVSALRAALRRLIEEPTLLGRLRTGIRPVITMAEHADQVEAIYREVIQIRMAKSPRAASR
jgi:glycosyltransferase involved in cell wall biosynthesis